MQAAAGPGNTPYSAAPLNQLYVRQLSHDRNINDYTLENQTEVTAKFDTAFVGHTLLMGIDLDYEAYTNKTSTRTGACNGIPLVAGSPGCVAAGFTTGGNTPSERSQPAGQLCDRRRPVGFGHVCQRHRPGAAVAQARRRRALGRLFGADRQLDQFGQHARQHDSGLLVADRLLHQRSHRRDHRADAGAVLLLLLQHVVQSVARAAHRDDRVRPVLPPETNEGFEAGVKYELLNGNLSLNGALFQITKNNARTANADGTFTPTGTVRVQGARAGVAGQITARLAGVRRLRLPERAHPRRPPPPPTASAAPPATCRSTRRGTRPTSGRPTRSTKPTRSAAASTYVGQRYANNTEYGAGAGVHPRRSDRGLQAAEVRRPLQRLQPVQHDVLRPAHGVGRRSRRPGLGH